MTRSVVSLFSGGGLKTLGAVQAGYTPVLGVEMSPDIAAVYADNIGAVTVAKVEDVDPRPYAGIELLLASPVCTNASVANAGRGERGTDRSAAEGVCRWLREARPERFVMENVTQYREFDSCKSILNTLTELGYWWSADNCNFADMGGTDWCPLHDLECTRQSAASAGSGSCLDSMTPAPDIAAAIAGMRPGDQAMHLAKIAVARLDRATLPAIAAGAVCDAIKPTPFAGGQTTTHGSVAGALTSEDMSEFASMGATAANTASWLNGCLDALLPEMRSYTTSTETRRITALKILGCILATPSIRKSITTSAPSLTAGASVIGGECPLCRYWSVPQTRRRLVVRAIRDAMLPALPAPTPWTGWYAAIEDILHTLPESRFADWQLARLPAELFGTALADCGNPRAEGITLRSREEPCHSITASAFRRPVNDPKAFLIEGDAAGDRPPTGGRVHRAFLCGVQGEAGELARDGGTPSPTITTAHDAAKYRAFLVSDFTEASGERVGVPHSHAPAGTVRTNATGGTAAKAFLVSEQYRQSNRTEQREPQTFAPEECAPTVLSGHKGKFRAWLEQGRVVALTPRALARLMTMPDDYKLPASRRLACTIIGNGVPCEGVRRILEGLG